MEQKENRGSPVRLDRAFAVLAVIAVISAAVAYGLLYHAAEDRDSETGIYYAAESGMTEEDKAEAAVSKEAADAAANEGDSAAEGESDVVSVFVCGAVKVPDVYELDRESLVRDAVQAAGGFSEKADVSYRNLAEKVTDGEKIYIPTLDETAGSGLTDGRTTDTAHGGTDARVNINTASLAQLKTLPGIGDAKAEAVIAYREAHGGFQSTEEIMQVSGIKEALYSRIKDYIKI